MKQQINRGMAAIASVIWPGLGPLYMRQTRKGISFIVVGVLLAALLLHEYRPARPGTGGGLLPPQLPLFFLVLVLLLGLWIYGIYDTFKSAKKISESAD